MRERSRTPAVRRLDRLGPEPALHRRPLALGHISKRGDAYLRNLLVQGARSVLQTEPAHQDHLSRWALELQARRGYYRTLVAIANKNARIAWALLARDQELKIA